MAFRKKNMGKILWKLPCGKKIRAKYFGNCLAEKK
jgi:hypothetical protein